MSNSEIIIPATSKSENNCHETPGKEIESQLTDEINNCFDILHQNFSEIKIIIKNNKEATSIVPKPSQFDPNAPRIRVFVKSIRRKDVRVNDHREQKMINEEYISIEDNDHDGLVIDEIRDVVQTIVKAVFRIIENNFDQLANRSSNTLGMRVKDSLILKVQQTYRKEIPLTELKTSLKCSRRIVDDDLQIRFLPRIESPAQSSAVSENLSTKRKKSVSLAEEVKVFNGIENEFFPENEVGYLSELIDTQNDRVMNHERNPENEDQMCDFTSQKSSTSPVDSESSFFDKFNTVGTTERSTRSFSRDQKIEMHKTASKDDERSEPRISSEDLKKFNNPGEKPVILSNAHLVLDEDGILQKAQTSGYFTRDMIEDVPNLSIAPFPNENQLIVSLVETTTRENVQTQLIRQGKGTSIKLSETENGDDQTSIHDEEQIEHEPIASAKKPSISNVENEIKHEEEQSTKQSAEKGESEIFSDVHKDHPRDGSDENSSIIDVLNENKVLRKKSSTKNTRSKRSRENAKSSIEALDFSDKTASENSSVEKKKVKQIKKWMNEFVYNRRKSIRDKHGDEDESRVDSQPNQSLKNSNQQSATIIAVVTIDSASVKLGQSQTASEHNNEDKISEKRILAGITVNSEESQDDGVIFTPEAQFNFERLSDVVQKISDHEISEIKERSASLSQSKRADKDERAGNETVRSSRDNGDKGLFKFLKKTFSTDKVEGGSSVKLRNPSLAQKRVNKNKNDEEAAAIQDAKSEGRGNRTSTNKEEGISTHSANSDTEDDPDAESNCTKAVEKGQSTEGNISLAYKFPNLSSEYEGVNHDMVNAIENQEIGKNSEKRTSLFSRIIRSKNRTEKNITSEKTVADDDTVDQKKNSDTLQQQLGESMLSDEKLGMISSFDMKMSSTPNSPPSAKTSSRVFLGANKLSKKSSRTESSADLQSTNDPSLKQSSSKVFRKASKSSGKLSRTDISDVIIPGPNNPAVETLVVSSQGRNVPNETDNFHVENTSASENELKLTQRLKTNDKSESSLKRIQTQIYPVAADNILQLDLLSSAQKMIDDEIDKVEIKSNRSHWSLFSKKSSARIKSDKQEINERESPGNDAKDFAKEPLKRQKSMLNVASTLSGEKDGVIRDDLRPENDLDITDNKSSKSFLEVKTSKLRNKSEDSLKALQIHAASVNTNVDQSDHPMEPFISSKKRNKFIEGLKRGLQSRRSDSKRSGGKSETKLRVSSESQTDMDEEITSESLTETKDGNGIEQSMNNHGRSSGVIIDDLLLDHEKEAGSVLSTDDEHSYPQRKSSIFQRLSERSMEKGSKAGKVTDLVEDVIQKSISEVSKQLNEETPKNITKVYSVAVDSNPNPNQDHSSTCKITDLSSNLDLSQDLGERIPNELELVLKSSEELELKPEQTERDKFSFKVNKSFAKILQKMSLTNSSKRTSKCLDDDELSKNEDTMNEPTKHKEEKSSKTTRSVRKKSGKEIKMNERNAVNVEEDFSRKSEPISAQIISETESKSETDKTTIRNSSQISTGKSESLVIAYVVEPSVKDQSDGLTVNGDEVQFDSNLIENETREQQSHDLMRPNEEKHGLLSNIKSIFKTSKKSEPQKRSLTNIEDSKNIDVMNKSLHSLKTAGSSEINVEREQSVHSMKESLEIPTIQSMKSLQDNRKRSKNRRRPGHKLFDDKDTPFITENIVEKSFQATVSGNFMPRQDEDTTVGFGVDGKANSSEESVAKSNSQMLLADDEVAEEETVGVSDRRKGSKKQQNPEGNTKKFAISLSRIFSNSSRKRNGEKESRPAADSQTNPEEHFEITRIPLSSSDDSSAQRNDKKSEVTEDNREELVAIKSLDSMHDSDNRTANRESIVKRSSRVLESKYTTRISNDELLRPGQSGTVIFSAAMKADQIASENELAQKDSIDNVQEMEKPPGKMYIAKGTIVSYAPMVESAKYISDELDDRSNEDDQPEKRAKRSSGKNFAAIRKLFSLASIRSRQDHATIEDRADDEDKKESLNSVKSSIIRHRRNKDRSVDQLNDENKRESIISSKRIKNEREEQESCTEVKKLLSRSKVKIRQPENTESPVVHNEVLLVNNVEISRIESANVQSGKNSIDDCENGSKPATMKSDEVDIAEIKVNPNHDGLMPTQIAERVVVDDIVIPPASQKDLNNTVDIEQKLSQRSSDTRKGSLLSMAKSYIKRRTEIETEEEMEGVNRCADKKSADEESMRPSTEDLKKTSKEQGVAKTESVFSRGLKRLFKKRSSVVESNIASNDYGDDAADDLSNSLNAEAHPHMSTNNSIDVIIGTESHGSGKRQTNRASDDTQFTVYNVNSKTKCPGKYEENSQRLENESSAAPGISETRIADGFQTQANPESKTRVDQEETVTDHQFHTKISSKDFKLNSSFASKRSTIVMMAASDPPRKEPQTEDSNRSNHPRDESSNSPTAFYYLLGPSLDEALVDVRVLFQNLIDKITGRGR